MSEERSTTIAIKERTRKRLSYVRDLLSQPDYETTINALLDSAGYPSWQEAERFARSTRDQPKKPEVPA